MIRDKLDHLYNMGFVDRKAVGGRGNPYAYWKSPACFADSESEKSIGSIWLKDDEMSLSIISGEIKSTLRIKDNEFNRVWPEYIKRFREQVKRVLLESPEIITKPETGFSEPKKEADFTDLENAKSLGSVAAPGRVKERAALGDVQAETEEKLKPEDVLSLIRLDPPNRGICPLCQHRAVLEWQVTKHNGEWGFLCGDCGWTLQEELGKGKRA